MTPFAAPRGTRARWRAESLATVPFVAAAAEVAYCGWVGETPAMLACALAAGLLATALLPWLVQRLSRSRGREMPGMKVPLSALALTWSPVLYATTGRLHAVQLAWLVLTMSLAVCYVGRRAAIWLCVYGLALSLAAMALMCRVAPEVYAPRVQWFYSAMLLGDLPALLLIGRQLFALRWRLRRQQADLEAAVARLRMLADRDDLTGLPNRRYAVDRFDQIILKGAEAGRMCAVALIDLDDFKSVNDTHGHDAGDLVLQQFARHAAAHLREIDLLARWGGEEFLVLYPGTDTLGAAASLARLRDTLETAQVLALAPGHRIRFSAGIAAASAGESLEAALARADEALYAAKAAGRHRSVVQGVDAMPRGDAGDVACEAMPA